MAKTPSKLHPNISIEISSQIHREMPFCQFEIYLFAWANWVANPPTKKPKWGGKRQGLATKKQRLIHQKCWGNCFTRGWLEPSKIRSLHVFGQKRVKTISLNTWLPRTQMTLVLIGKGLVLGGWPSKIEVIGALGIVSENDLLLKPNMQIINGALPSFKMQFPK